MQPRAPKLFIGVGNALRHDDGVGVRAAEVMADLPLPSDVEVYEAGTVGVEAAGVIERRELVVVVDAIDTGGRPGTVCRFGADELRPLVPATLTLHQVHLLDALTETRLLGTAPTQMVFHVVQVADTSTGIGLTPPVEAAVKKVVELVLQELGLPVELANRAAAVSSWAS